MPTIAEQSGSRAEADQTCSPYFFVQSDDAAVDRMPLKSTAVAVDIAGVIADVRVTQVYCNAGARPIEAVYVFPGSTRAAVYGLKMTIGERTIVAHIERKQAARQQYEDAKKAGQSASLLEQHRPNVFQMNVANIMPGDDIRVELAYTELLVPTDGEYEFVYPTVVGPRYPGSQSDGVAAEAWVENPYLREDAAPVATFDIRVNLSAGLPVQKAVCASHQTDIRYDSPSFAAITLKPSETGGGNRDYMLKYRLAGGQIESGLLLFEADHVADNADRMPALRENFFLLMAQPPETAADAELPPREYIFIMDVSGSMGGFPMDVAKTLLTDLMRHLGPDDRFNLMQFSFGAQVLSPSGSVPATAQHVSAASKLLKRASGSGGTELLPALRMALDLPRAAGMSCSIVVITDGFVTVEPEVFDLVRRRLGEANLFAFGIGASVNRHLIEGLARVGGGEPFIVTNETEAAAKAASLRRCIRSPVLTNLKLKVDGFDAYDIEPPALPDVFAERPVLCYGKWQGARKGTLTLTGRAGAQEYRYAVDLSTVAPQPTHAALRYLWARQAVTLLGDYNALRQDQERVERITQLGLNYSLLTDYTSFIAVDSEIRNIGGQTTTVNQPVPLPQGVPELAVRSAVPSPMTVVRKSMAARASLASFDRMGLPAPEFDACAEAAIEAGAYGGGDDLPFGLAEEGRVSEAASLTRIIGVKTFRLCGAVWVDAAHAEGAALIRIRRDSDAYRALLRAIPALAAYFEAVERILVNLGPYSIEIAPDGSADLTPDDIGRLRAAWRAAHVEV